jgi:glutamine phosphoribosylpyrophosphate amidotransferase
MLLNTFCHVSNTYEYINTSYAYKNTLEYSKGLTQLKFVGRVSVMGDRKIIYIPKEFHKQAEKLEGRQVKILVDDEI